MSVTVDHYNPAWPEQFKAIKIDLQKYLRGVEVISIEHVGSTSVPGLAAKPIIDIDIVVSRANVQPALDALATLGNFDVLGELGIKDRHTVKDPNQTPSRNTYVCVEDAFSLRNHLSLRDLLRTDDKLRDEYACVKLELAARDTNIIDYIEAKGAIIVKILRLAGRLTEAELAEIEKANEKGEKFGAIRTKHLLLREFCSRDVDPYHMLESNEENARFQDWLPRTREQARQLVMENIRTGAESPRRIIELAVEHGGVFIGRVGAKWAPKTGNGDNQRHADLWFSFMPAAQGKGFATEAMTAFIDALVERQRGAGLGLEIECDPRNRASWALAERLGFEKYSLTERAWESKGEWVDSLVYRKAYNSE